MGLPWPTTPWVLPWSIQKKTAIVFSISLHFFLYCIILLPNVNLQTQIFILVWKFKGGQKKSRKCQKLLKCLSKNCWLWELSWMESLTVKNRKNRGEKMKVSDITIVINIMNITTNINIDIIHLLKPHHYRHHHHHYHHQEEKKKIEFSFPKGRM